MTGDPAPRLGWLRPWYGVPLAAAIALLAGLLRLLDPAPLETIRLLGFDLLQRSAPLAVSADEQVLIVDIDEESLAALGQWPWPRWRMAALVDRILAGEPAALAIDIFFAEPDRLSPERVAAEIPALTPEVRERLAALPSNDERLGAAIARGPVTLAVAGSEIAPTTGAALDPRTPIRLYGAAPTGIVGFPGRIASLPSIRDAARGEGLVNVQPERDNIVRRVAAVARIGDGFVPLLMLDAVRLGFRATGFGIVAASGGVDAVRIGPLELPTTSQGLLWPRLGRHDPGRYVSAIDLLRRDDAEPRLAGRIVILGSTASALGDFHATALERRMPGPEIQAQVAEAALVGALLRRPPLGPAPEAMLVALFTLLAAVALPYRRPLAAAGILIGAAVVLACLTVLAYRFAGWLVDGLTPVASGAVVFAQMVTAQLLTTDSERRRVAEALQRQREAAARVEGELAAARQIQMGMLPQVFPAPPGVEIFARLEPARAIGGDFYDVATLPDGRIYFAVGDVSGKGVPAALFMALAKALSRAGAGRPVAVAAMATRANAELVAENPAQMFVTLLAGILDPRSGAVELVNAGHEPPLLLSPGYAAAAIEGEGGPPLCVIDDFDYPGMTLQLQPGEVLLVSTDGVTDALTADGVPYGGERLRRLAASQVGLGARSLVDAIFADLDHFAFGAEPADDITVLAIRWQGEGPSGQ